ncbi:MAG: DUF2461 domain-containing protein [Pseudomonadota bacterium]
MSSFDGFSRALPDYLGKLAKNNSKSWFDAHRDEYDQLLIEPAKAFVEAVGARLEGEVASGLTAKPAVNGSIRRMNRDLRFSADKTPYNTRLHLIFWGGPKPNQGSAFHLVIASDHVGIGAGQWQFSPAQLAAYRSAVCDPARATALEQAVATAHDAGVGDLHGPHLKRPPSGFEAASGFEHLLLNKSVVVRGNMPDGDRIFGAQAVDHTIGCFAKLAPLHNWLVETIPD